MDRPQPRLPKVIGHRGAALRAPENTLAGFRKAAALGCKAVEFDVRLSLEGAPVVFHDDTLERVTNGSGRVGATALSALKALDAGASFDPAYRGEAIPTLEEVLEVLKSLGLAFDLELKAEPGREAALAEAVALALERHGPSERAPALVTSFEAEALAAFARRAPRIPRGYLVQTLSPAWRAEAEALGAGVVICDHRRLSPDGLKSVKGAGYPLLVYTVNHPSRARELFGWGVDGVISDAPDAILALA